MNWGQHIVVLALRVYRLGISPALGALTVPLGLGCRFTPTCSQYALEAVQCHGVLRGSVLALRRLCRCHPWGGYGADPVPLAEPRVVPARPLAGGCSQFRIDGNIRLRSEAPLLQPRL